MKKTLSRLLIGVVVLQTSIVGSIMAQEKPKLPSREFMSDNEMYTVQVQYEGRFGKGKAKYTLKNRKGEILWSKTHDIAPYKVVISNKGNSVVAFGGGWYDTAHIDKIGFYDEKGKFLKEYRMRIVIGFEYAFSDNEKTFVLVRHKRGFGRRQSGVKEIICFATRTGRIRWRRELDHNWDPRSMTLSKNGKWILVSIANVTPVDGSWTKAKIQTEFYLFDIKGKRHWKKEFENGKMKGSISDEGDYLTFFAWNKKTVFRNEGGKVTFEKEEKLSTPWGGNIK